MVINFVPKFSPQDRTTQPHPLLGFRRVFKAVTYRPQLVVAIKFKYNCARCCAKIDRDYNAARNICLKTLSPLLM